MKLAIAPIPPIESQRPAFTISPPVEDAKPEFWRLPHDCDIRESVRKAVIQHVSRAFGVDEGAVMERHRDNYSTWLRHVSIYLMVRLVGNRSAVGRMIDRDLGSVCNAVNIVHRHCRQFPTIRAALEDLEREIITSLDRQRQSEVRNLKSEI